MSFFPFFLRELKKHLRFSALFVLLLGIGLSGFLLVEALRASVARSLDANSRAILAADLSVSIRRPFTFAEHEKLRTLFGPNPYTLTTEFFSMITYGKESRLVLVKAVDAAYPLIGQLETSTLVADKVGIPLSGEKKQLVVSPEVLEQLGVILGEPVSIGGESFSVLGTITNDPTQSFRTFALGGRAYLSQRHLKSTNLLQPGSTATYSYLLLTGGESKARALKNKIQKEFPDPEWRVTTAKESGESSMRALHYLGDFLGLVSLVALLLAALGAAYLYRSYLEKRKQEIAIYRALGVSLRFIQRQAMAQTVLLSLLSLLPSLLFAWALLPALESLINQWSLTRLNLSIYPESILPLFLLCLVGTPLLLLPELLVLKRFAPLALFREQDRESMRRPFVHQLPALLLFLALAPLVARSWRIAGIFLGLLAALVAALFVAFLLFSKILRAKKGRWTTRHAFFLLARRKRSAATVFLTLSLGSLLIHLLPQLEASLRAELEAPTRLPSLFFFDIQQEQKAPLEKSLASLGHTLTSISPLVRARIVAINGTPFVRETESASFRTREDEQNTQFRNRAVNLSYRGTLQESETLIRGRPFTPEWDGKGVPELSIETRFAERLGVRIGDILRFDVQGTEIEGKIVNERRVRWTSFQPNFFLVFQNGVLNDAPSSFLANLGALPKAQKAAVQSQLAKDFPNVSVVDVAATISQALDLLGRMRLALVLLAALALAAGLSVLASVLRLEARDRAKSLILYRTLGASEGDLRRIIFTESLVVSSVAIAFGAIGSVGFTYGLSAFMFDGAFKIAPLPLFGFSAILLAIGICVSYLATRSLVKRSPLEILRESSY